jgi:hypothetical protein
MSARSCLARHRDRTTTARDRDDELVALATVVSGQFVHDSAAGSDLEDMRFG